MCPDVPAITVATGLWLLACAAMADEAPKLKALRELRLDVASEGAVIVSPATPEYRRVAATLAEGLGEIAGGRPRIAPDSSAPENLGDGPIIVLGNLMDSALARSLYLQAYDFTDYAWPSAGGHALRTIRDPLGSGADVLMVAGSDVDGVGEAARELVSIVRADGAKLGYLNRVKLGRWAREIQSYTDELLGSNDSIWERSGVSGSWDYQIQIAKAGIGYLRTGNEDYLASFKRELRYWFDHDVYHPKGDAPQMLHGFLNQLVIAWDLVRDHPCFSEEERREFERDFLHVFRSREGPGRIDGASKARLIRDNHGTRTGLDAVFGGRYFARRFGLEEGKQWLEIADRYFAPQMESAKPVEDSWGHQWAASLFNTLVYAMAAGKEEYFGSTELRLAADRAVIAHPNAGAPQAYMCACAVAASDTGYLSGWAGGEDLGRRGAAMKGHGDEYLRSFCTGQDIAQRQDLLGVSEAPVDQLWYESIDAAGFNPGGLFAVTAPREECFDKISIREDWRGDDFYLLLDGISGGHHSYQDGNCIVQYWEGGAAWLAGARNFNQAMTVRTQNGVFVALDGAGPGRLQRYARKLYTGQAGEYLAVAAGLEGVGGVDWHRHIIRKRGRWTLVIDRAIPKQSGEIIAERHWHVRGKITPRPDGLVSVMARGGRDVCLHLQSAGLERDGMSGTTDRREMVRASASPGNPLEFATLLHVNEEAGERDFELSLTEGGWRIDSADGPEFVAVDGTDGEGLIVLRADGVATIGNPSDGGSASYHDALSAAVAPRGVTLPLRPSCPRTHLPWREWGSGGAPVTAVAIAPDGRVAAGDSEGAVRVFAPDGAKLCETSMRGGILSLHFVGWDVIVGEERGALTRIGPDGGEAWQVVIPYVPMAWPYWSEEKSRVREITSADINGDGEHEILISNSDRRVYAFSGEGREVWQAPVEWGIFTAMTPGEHGERVALYGGTSRPSIHGYCILLGADGRIITRMQRPDLVSWSVPSQFRDMRLADLDGDGEHEIINALDTNCRQLVVYKQSGELLWDADVAGPAEAISVVSKAGEASAVLCASGSGYVSAYEGATGERRWACYVGEPTVFVAPYQKGRVIAVSRSGRVFVIDGDGRLAGHDDLGRPVTALLRPGDHRGANAIVLGTEAGRVVSIP